MILCWERSIGSSWDSMRVSNMFEALVRGPYIATKSVASFMWGIAGALSVLVECLALIVLFVQYRRVSFPFNAPAIALALTAWIPWFAARRVLRIYKISAGSRTAEEAQTNISYHLATLVISTSVLLIVAITMVQVRVLE